MKTICGLLLALLLLAVCAAQNPPAAPGSRTDVYHVHFAKAALGKGAEEGDFLKTPNPNAPMGEHHLVLRHQDGDDWDYVAIDHLGPKATVDASALAPASVRDLNAWHTDSFVNGPSWPEFVRAMGLGDQSTKTAGSVYVVTVVRAAPGHRDQLEKALSQPPGAGTTAAGLVLMQHVEGGPWHFLTITRYNSWQDFATNEKNTVPDTLKAGGGWLALREHSTFHNDTLTDRIAP